MTSPSTNYQPIAPAPPSPAQNLAALQSYQPVASTSATPSSSAPPPTLKSNSPKPTARSGPPAKKKRRSKVESACRFCRKSHMACDGQRPCTRCVKREIAHLCTDEPTQPSQPSTPPSAAPAAAHIPETSSNSTPAPLHVTTHQQHHPPHHPHQQQLHHQPHGDPNADPNNVLNTLGLDIGAALRGNGANGGGGGNPLAGIHGSLFGSNPHQHQEQHSPAYGDFNMALVRELSFPWSWSTVLTKARLSSILRMMDLELD